MSEKLARCQNCGAQQPQDKHWIYVLYEPSGRWLWVCGTCAQAAAKRHLPRKNPNQL